MKKDHKVTDRATLDKVTEEVTALNAKGYGGTLPEKIPTTKVEEIQGLLPAKEGFRCDMCEEYFAPKQDSIRTHQQQGKCEGLKAEKGSSSPGYLVQQLSTYKPHGRYFEVFRPPPLNRRSKPNDGGMGEYADGEPAAEDPLVAFLEECKKEIIEMSTQHAEAVISRPFSCDMKRDPGPWLHTVGWPSMFENKVLRSVHAVANPNDSAYALPKQATLMGNVDSMLRQLRKQMGAATVNALLLVKSCKEEPATKPFRWKLGEPTVQSYNAMWSKLIVYVVRLSTMEQSDDLFIPDMDAQDLSDIKRLCGSILDQLNSDSDFSDADQVQALKSKVFELSVAILKQSTHVTDDDPTGGSLLMRFLSIQGIVAPEFTWRTPNNFTPLIARLMFCAKIILYHHTVKGVTAAHPDLDAKSTEFKDQVFEGYKAIRKPWAIYGSNSPIGAMLRIWSYGKVASKGYQKAPNITWSHDDPDLLYYCGEQFRISALERFGRLEVEEADIILSNFLLFLNRDEYYPLNSLAKVVDDMPREDIGYGFGSINNKTRWDYNPATFVLERIQSNPKLRDTFMHTVEGVTIWKTVAVERYLERVDEMVEYLLVLFHITGGGAARGTELPTIRYRNDHFHRSLFVISTYLAFVTKYHKSEKTMDQWKVIPRFVPNDVGLLAANFVIYVLPFASLLRKKLGRPSDGCHLFTKGDITITSRQFSKLLERHSIDRMGHRLTLHSFRDIMSLVDRKYLGNEGVTLDEYGSNFDGSDPDEPTYEDDKGEAHVTDVLFGHSRTTRDLHYGIQKNLLSSLSTTTIETCLKACIKYHEKVLGLQPNDTKRMMRRIGLGDADKDSSKPTAEGNTRNKRKRRAEEAETEEQSERRKTAKVSHKGSAPTTKLITSSPDGTIPIGSSAVDVGPSTVSTYEEVVDAMVSLYGPGFRWRSPKQLSAVQSTTAVKGGRTLIVLPTGMGKTLCGIVPSMLPDSGLVVVITPYVASGFAWMEECRKLDVDYTFYDSSSENSNLPPSGLLITSAETAVTGKFKRKLAVADSNGSLDLILFDECHTILTEKNFRSFALDIYSMAGFRTSVAMMTGTMPPTLTYDLFTHMKSDRWVTIRECTNRPNIAVYPQWHTAEVIDDELYKLVRDYLPSNPRRPSGKCIVYCKTKSETEALAAKLGCDFYHAELDNDSKLKVLERFSKGDMDIIVATTGLNASLNVPSLDRCVMKGIYYDAITVGQQIGRCGRDGRPSKVFILMKNEEWGAQIEYRAGGAPGNSIYQAAYNLVHLSCCTRLQLGAYFDGDGADCFSRPDNLLCDFCIRKHGDKNVKLLSGFEAVERAQSSLAIETSPDQPDVSGTSNSLVTTTAGTGSSFTPVTPSGPLPSFVYASTLLRDEQELHRQNSGHQQSPVTVRSTVQTPMRQPGNKSATSVSGPSSMHAMQRQQQQHQHQHQHQQRQQEQTPNDRMSNLLHRFSTPARQNQGPAQTPSPQLGQAFSQPQPGNQPLSDRFAFLNDNVDRSAEILAIAPAHTSEEQFAELYKDLLRKLCGKCLQCIIRGLKHFDHSSDNCPQPIVLDNFTKGNFIRHFDKDKNAACFDCNAPMPSICKKKFGTGCINTKAVFWTCYSILANIPLFQEVVGNFPDATDVSTNESFAKWCGKASYALPTVKCINAWRVFTYMSGTLNDIVDKAAEAGN